MKMKLLFCGGYFTTYSYVNSTESSESSQIIAKGGRISCSFHSPFTAVCFLLAPLIIQQTTFPLPSCIMMAANGWYIYTGGFVIPPGVTRVRID